MKKAACTVLLLVLLFTFTFSVSAADSAATDTFTHWTLSNGSNKTVVMRPIYQADEKISARSLGLDEDYGKIVQIAFDPDGNLYILTEQGEIIILDCNFQFLRKAVVTDRSGQQVNFEGASGFSVVSSNEIYIADTKNVRVLKCVNDIVEQEITVPQSALIPADFDFQPTKVVKDSKGYLYVLSAGSYYGVVLYDPDGEFVGFYGANTVRGTILTTLKYAWDALTKNDVKRAKAVKKLPYQIIDICIDDNDFIYTCTGKNAGGAVGQIRMLSPGGSNILVGSETKNFGETEKVKRRKADIAQNFTGIVSDSRGFIYALDSSYGFIYIYDTKSNLIGAFGGGIGNGNQLGVFTNATSIAVSGSCLLVSDSTENTVTVFRRTEYGNMLFSAQELSLHSDYLGAEQIWQKVYAQDGFNRLALVNLAKAAYDRGDYSDSMKYAKAAEDGDLYSQALKKIQSEYLSRNWTWIFTAALLLVGLITALMILSIKRHPVLIRNEKLHTMATAAIHPFRSFNDIKYKQMGSLPSASVLVLLFFATSVCQITMSNFRYTTFDAATFNSVLQLVKTVGLVALWVVSNWAVCTVLKGVGRFKEVFIVTAYSLLPMIVYYLLSTPLSHLISSGNSNLISGLNSLALIVTGIMLCIGHMVIHEYSLPKFLITAALTVVFMILILFVLFMIGILLSQFWSFAVSIVLEAIRWK